MRLANLGFGKRGAHVAVVAAGVAGLLALQPESTGFVQAWAQTGAARDTIVRRIVLSDQALRYLTLQYRSYPTEFIGCMLGEVRGSSVIVWRVAPADVDPSQSAPTHVVPKQSCEQAGWVGTVGVIHSHPGAQYCWYAFPGTQVLTSDGQAFLRQPYPVDAIMCGDRVVWISRDMVERQLSAVGPRELTAAATLEH